MVDGIAAAIGDSFPPRCCWSSGLSAAFQIVAGHHRVAAARAAGLDEVSCWVREMDDEAAFMALVLANSQSELSALERGMHALRSGAGVREYARSIERAPSLVVRERQAAEVFTRVNSDATLLADKAKQLAELHAAAPWLWPTLVARLIAEGWNVETARGQAARLWDAPEPPVWADREALAKDSVAGKARSNERSGASAASQDARHRRFLACAPLDPLRTGSLRRATMVDNPAGEIEEIHALCDEILRLMRKSRSLTATAADVGGPRMPQAQSHGRQLDLEHQLDRLERWVEQLEARAAERRS